MAAATVTIVRPVLGFDGSSYTAEGTLIHVGKANLTLGIAGVLTDKAKGFHSVLVPYTGNPVLDGSTEIIPPITSISTSGQPAGTQARATTTAIAPSNRADTDQSASSSKQHTLSSSRDDASTSTSSSVSNSAATGASAQTPSSSTPSSSVGSEHDASNGIASGAAAGIGIGCAAVGALIAGLLVFLLMRKRRNKNPLPREYSLDEKSPTSPQQAGGNSRSLDPASGTSAFALAERDLPQPLEDAAIGGEMSRLQTLVKNYAQSYYLTSPVAAKNVDLTELGPSLPVPAPTLAAMLASPKTRISAIRFCLMWTIISRVGTDNEPSTSLLPPEVSNLLRSMPTASHAHKPSTLAPWRVLTHSLLTPTPSPSLSHNSASLQLALRTLDTILQPYADPAHDSYERLSKLEEILKRGARFGWMMFGELAELGLEWRGLAKVGQGGEGGRFVLVEKLKGKKKGERMLWEGEEVKWTG